jgi:hypothetical protein
MNRRGEVITVSLIAICLLAGVLGLFVGGSKYGKMVGLSSDQKIVKTVKSEPIILKGADGKDYWVQKTEESTSNADVPMSLLQRVMMLPKILILLVILGCIFPPLGIVLVALYTRLKGGLKQMVSGIEQAKATMAPDAKFLLENNLSKKMDTNIKSAVKKIKVKL